RQPPPGPAAPCRGLVPIDENNRSIGTEDLSAIVAAPCPDAVRFPLPVNWTFCTQELPPRPTGLAPKFTNAVTTSLNTSRHFAIGRRGVASAQRAELALLCPMPVI